MLSCITQDMPQETLPSARKRKKKDRTVAAFDSAVLRGTVYRGSEVVPDCVKLREAVLFECGLSFLSAVKPFLILATLPKAVLSCVTNGYITIQSLLFSCRVTISFAQTPPLKAAHLLRDKIGTFGRNFSNGKAEKGKMVLDKVWVLAPHHKLESIQRRKFSTLENERKHSVLNYLTSDHYVEQELVRDHLMFSQAGSLVDRLHLYERQ